MTMMRTTKQQIGLMGPCLIVGLVIVASSTTCNGFSPSIQSSTSTSSASPIRKGQAKLKYINDYGHSSTLEKSILFAPPTPQEQVQKQQQQQKCNNVINNRHSSSDWLYNLRTLPDSSVLRETKQPVLTCFAWATFVSVMHKVLLASGKGMLATRLCVPHQVHSFLVSSLGLLLVFRTNSAYQRFLEGRKIWEEISSISRNLSRFLTLYESDVGMERQQRMKNLLASFPYLLRHHVRSGCLCKNTKEILEEKYKLILNEPSLAYVDTRYEGDKVSGGAYTASSSSSTSSLLAATRPCYVDRRDMPWNLLDDPQRDTLARVAQATNRPLWVCDRLGKEIMDVPYTPCYTSRERLKLLDNVDKLTNAIGQCERIHQTAVPLNYARHCLRSLSIWLLTLPFCLIKDLGLMTGPVTAVIAWVLFGVYQIGHSIEDPFQGSLRLSILCDAIRRDVLGREGEVSSSYNQFQAVDNHGSLQSSYSTSLDIDSDDEGDDDDYFAMPDQVPTKIVRTKDGTLTVVGV